MRMKTVTAAVLALGFAAGSAGAVELKANHYLPPKHPVASGYEVFAKTLEAESKGDLKVKIFGGGSLLGAKATVDGIRDGVADIGFVVNTYFPAQFPIGRLMSDLSMVGDDGLVATLAITELYTLHCPLCLAEHAGQNEVYLGTTSTPPYVLIGKDGLATLDGIKGRKLRAGGSLWDRFAKSVGAVGVNVPSSDMYEGLSRGIIDATIYAVGGLKTHSLGDIAKAVVMLPVGAFRSDNLFAFNMDRWAELTPAQRTAVLRATAAGTVEATYAYEAGDKEGFEVAKQKNIPIEEPSAELLAARDAFVKADVDEAIERAKSEYKIADPKAVVDAYMQLYDKYEKLLAPIRDDQQKVTELMWTEVLSKVDVNTYGMKK